MKSLVLLIPLLLAVAAYAQPPSEKGPPSSDEPAIETQPTKSDTKVVDPLQRYTPATRAFLTKQSKNIYRMPDGGIVDANGYAAFVEDARDGKLSDGPPVPLLAAWREGKQVDRSQAHYLYMDKDGVTIGKIEDGKYTLFVRFRSYRTHLEMVAQNPGGGPHNLEALKGIASLSTTRLDDCTLHDSARQGSQLRGRHHFFVQSSRTLYDADALRMKPAELAAAIEAGELVLSEWKRVRIKGESGGMVWVSETVKLQKRAEAPSQPK